MHNSIATISVFATAVALAGCASLQPELPEADAQIRADWPASSANAGASESFGVAEANQIAWRDFYTDAKLEQLIEKALENNRDLAVAIQNVQRARAQYRIQRSDRLPSVSGTANMTRLGGDGQQSVEQYEAQLGVSQFEIDLFGRVRNLSDAALRSYLATEEAQKSAQLSLVAEVANAYLTLSADLELQRIAQATYENYQENYDISERRHELGAVSALDLSQARTLLASARADLALYEGQVHRDKTSLELLVGAPVEAALLPDSYGLEVSGVASLPAEMPSEVLLRRPDIHQAELLLQAANANLGAARAAFFPSIRLTGAIGSVSGDLSDLFSDGTDTWSFLPQVTVPIFQGGRLRANREVAAADREIALARYEQAIQAGFKEVSDAMVLSGTFAERTKALQDFVDSASETEALSQSRYDAGRDSYLNLLDAQRTLYGARQALVQSQLSEQSNRINLYKALGGGWSPDS